MQNPNETAIPTDITLVDLDDLRAAFGGEAAPASAPAETAADSPVSTLMCPSW